MAKLLQLFVCVVVANALLSNAQSVTANESMTAVPNATIMQQASDGSMVTPTPTTTTTTTPSGIVEVMNEYRLNGTKNVVVASRPAVENILLSSSASSSSSSSASSMNESGGNDNADISNAPVNLLPEMFDFNLDDFEDITNGTANYGDNVDDVSNDNRVGRILQETPAFEEFTLSPESVAQQTNDTRPMELSSKNIYKVAVKGRSKTVTADNTPITEQNGSTLRGNIAANSSLAAGHAFQLIVDLYDHSKWNIEAISKVVGANCSNGMRMYLSALHKEIPWAIQAMDQSGRYRGMFMFGNELWVGARSFCEEINLQRDVKSSEEKRQQPAVQFFAATIIMATSIQQTNKLQVCQCLPASCSTNEVISIIQLDPAAVQLIEITSTVNVTGVRTVPGAYKILDDQRFHLLLGIAIVVGIFVFIATVYELTAKQPIANPAQSESSLSTANINMHNVCTQNVFSEKHLELQQIQHAGNNNMPINAEIDGVRKAKHSMSVTIGGDQNASTESVGMFQQLLLSFGLISNTKTILSVNKLSEESVSCIHGMRVFSMMWTIMVHTYLQTFGISENKFGKTITERKFWYQAIANATYSVDTFFFLSGLLVTLLFLRGEDKTQHPKRTTVQSGTRKTILLLLYRYMRLTPAYFTALLCSEISLKYIYNQSVFQPGLTDHAMCPDFWWRNILYVQNWFPFPQLCMIWSWYLANDMQLYVWASILLVISTRFFKTSAAILCVFLLGSWTVSALISLNLNYTLRISEPLETFGFLYDKPWTRIGPYIMGMITGYLIYRYKNQPPRVSRVFNIFMWTVSMIIMFFVIFGIWDGTLNVIRTAFYVSLSHTAWGFALMWITLSCKWGLAEPINTFLSYPAFLPLSRLTYCTYLIHPVTQIVTAFQMQGPFHIQHIMVITVFLGSAVVSFGCAFVLSVMCEAPVVRILKIFF